MINVVYDRPRNLKGIKQSVFVSFRFKQSIVNAIRTFYKRFYDGATKTWELPYDSLDELRMQLPNEEFQITGKPIDEKKYKEKVVDTSIAMPKQLKTTLYPFQKASFYEGISQDKFILNLDTGLGKSAVSLAIVAKRMEDKEVKRCLVVPCVATLKYNWQNEIHTHLGQDAKVLGNRKNSKGIWNVKGNADKLEDLKHLTKDDRWLITNIESLRDRKIKEQIKKLIDKDEIQCIIVDEIHKCASPTAQQTKALMSLESRVKYSLLLTGTILMNRPTDLFVPLKIVGSETQSFSNFKSRYCVMGGFGGYQVVGFKHLDDLKYRLEQVSKRLRKEDVLTDLPSKVFINEYVDMGKDQTKIYNEALASIMENIDTVLLSPNPLSTMIRLRQATADTSLLSTSVKESAKFARAQELIKDIVADGNSVIVFSNWESVVSNFKKVLDKEMKTAIITGKVKNRQGEIDKFNTEGCNVMLMTIGAGGTGLTLNKASVVILLDEPWTAADVEQATSRCHRIGQQKSVVVYTLMCKNTIDEQIHKVVKRKGALGEAIVDAKFNLKDKNVLKYLLTGEGELVEGDEND